MESIKRIAHAIWNNRSVIHLGQDSTWDTDTFLQNWIDSRYPSMWCNKRGWYWFECNKHPLSFASIDTPLPFPIKGIKFNEVAGKNVKRFYDYYKLMPDSDSFVVYNGHEERVFTRMRTHFSLTLENSATGALGLAHYPLSHLEWKVGFFHEDMIDNISSLSTSDIKVLKQLVQEKIGREIIEICWRLEYGWPILCDK